VGGESEKGTISGFFSRGTWAGMDLGELVQAREAGVEIQASGVQLGVEYASGGFMQRIRYVQEPGERVGRWDRSGVREGSFKEIREGDFDLNGYLNGYLQIGINPEVEPTLWGSLAVGPKAKLFILPKVGIHPYVRAELSIPEAEVTIEQPRAGETLKEEDEITLKATASGDPELQLLAGMDLTLSDGSVVECPGDSTSLSLTLQRQGASQLAQDQIPGQNEYGGHNRPLESLYS
jgi:hypothetical protein